MANRHRGEIDARLDGTVHRLCLTLGALAELEAAFGDEDMLALAARFEKGRLKAVDCIRVIAAGLRGAGLDVTDDAVAAMQADGGAAGFVAIVASLLNATFSAAPAAASPSQPTQLTTAPQEVRAPPVPFPGTQR